MIKLSVQTNAKDITAKIRAFAKAQQQAAVRALNETAKQARTAASKEVRAAGYNIKASAIKKSFYIEKANRYNLEVALKATGRPITLVNYGARKVKAGVRVQVKNGPTIFRHAFIETMANGHRGVFQRIGKGHKKRMVSGKVVRTGLPIRELYGPSIPQGLNNRIVKAALMKMIREKFPKIFEHELRYFTSKR